MPKFKYVAIDDNGKHYKGVITSADETAVVNTLRKEKKALFKIEEIEEKKPNTKINSLVLADFCQQLGVLLSSGVTLVRALAIIINDDNIKLKNKAVFTRLLDEIRKGMSLSVAMENQGAVFPPLMIHMFRSAENSGSLDITAIKMAEHFNKEHKLNTKIKGAMVYPIILVAMIIGIVLFVSVYILPQFSELFESMGTLPILTQIIMSFSDLVINSWYLLIIGAVVLVAILRTVFSIPKVKLWSKKMVLRLPIIGKLLKIIYTARFARTLNSLYSSGIAILSAMPIAANTIGNEYIADQFTNVVTLLQQGEPLAKALSIVDGFENKLISSIKVGEEAGNLETMLEAIADSYDFSAEQAINKLVTFVEPVMLIFIGILVCIIMLGVLIPIFQSYNSIQ